MSSPPPPPPSQPIWSPSSAPAWTSTPPPPPPPPRHHASAPTPSGPRRRGLIVAGLTTLIVGLALGVGLVLFAKARATDAAKRLARASVGCATTLRVDTPGRFNVYLETKATLVDADGSCAGTSTTINHDGSTPGQPRLNLTDASGSAVVISPGSGERYDLDDYRGRRVGTFEVAAAGSLSLAVDGSDRQVVVAVGDADNSPAKVQKLLQTAGGGATILGALVGIPLLVIGLRRRPAPPGGGVVVVVPAGPAFPPTSLPPRGTVPPRSTPPPPPPPGSTSPAWCDQSR